MKRPGTYLAAGTVFTYNKYAGDKCPGECLYAPGPLTSDMDIQVDDLILFKTYTFRTNKILVCAKPV